MKVMSSYPEHFMTPQGSENAPWVAYLCLYKDFGLNIVGVRRCQKLRLCKIYTKCVAIPTLYRVDFDELGHIDSWTMGHLVCLKVNLGHSLERCQMFLYLQMAMDLSAFCHRNLLVLVRMGV